jgi:hypothetical protein
MRRLMGGWTFVLALALAIPTVAGVGMAQAKGKTAKSDDTAATGAPAANLSKDEQDKLKEHNRLRAEIKKVKYPAAKADVVTHIKGIKADDKKWVEQTLPDKTFSSPEDVYSALGWETTPAEGATGTTGAAGAAKTGRTTGTTPSTTK